MGKRNSWLIVVLILMTQWLGIVNTSYGNSNSIDPEVEKLLKHYETVISFGENKGQWDDPLLFKAKSNHANVDFYNNGFKITAQKKTNDENLEGHAWKLNFLGSNPEVEVSPKSKLDFISNYYLGAKKASGVSNYEEIWYNGIYENTDLRFYNDGKGGIEYDFILHPGADHCNILMGTEGLDQISINENGELVYHTSIGDLTKGKPYTYQVIDGVEIEVPSRYEIDDNGNIYFEVEEYDTNQPMIIDPVIMTYSTYIDGANSLINRHIDDNGNIYLTLSTYNPDLVTTTGAFQSTIGGSQDMIIAKFDPDGNPIYITHYGGAVSETPRMSALDGEDIIILGATNSTDFPVTAGAHQSTLGGSNDYFVLKLNASGQPIFATYLGGTGGENQFINNNSLQLSNGDILCGGVTQSTDFPVTPGAFQSTNNGGNDLVAFRFDGTGNLIYSTYLGGSGFEYYYNSFVYNDEFYAVGRTNSTDFPTTANAFQTSNAGGYDMVFTKIDATGNVVLNTYYGGTGNDLLEEIHVSANGILLSGISTSGTTTTIGAYQPNYGGGSSDGFILGLDLSMNINFATYLGGDDSEEIFTLRNLSNQILFDGTHYYITGNGRNGLGSSWKDFSNYVGPDIANSFIAKLDINGQFTYVNRLANGIKGGVVDLQLHNSNLYILGQNYSFASTTASNLALGATPFDATIAPGKSKGFIVSFDSNGNQGIGTWFGGTVNGTGGNGSNSMGNMTVDSNGSIHISGSTRAVNFPVTQDAIQTESFEGNGEHFYAILNSNGLLDYSTYLGGSGAESNAYHYINNGKAYLFGRASSLNYPITSNAHDVSNSGNNNAYNFTVLELCEPETTANTISVDQSTCINGYIEPFIGSDVAYIIPEILRDEAPVEISVQPSYQWQISTDNVNWANIPGATDKDFLAAPVPITTYWRRVISKNFCAGADDISNIVTVTVGTTNEAPELDGGGTFYTCPSTDVLIDATVTGGTTPYTYVWTPPTGLSDPAIEDPTANLTESGIFTITVTDNNGCRSVDQALVTIIQADAGPDAAACDGLGVQIGTPAIAGLAVTYEWTPATGLSDAFAAQPIANPGGTDPITYTLKLTLPNGCFTEDDVLVTPLAVPLELGPDVTVCWPGTLTLGEPTQPNTFYGWAPGLYIDSQTEGEVTFSSLDAMIDNTGYGNPNPIKYYLTKTDLDTGCSNNDSIQVYVNWAEAGVDGCGPRFIGRADHSYGGATFAWTVISGDMASIPAGEESIPQPYVNPNTTTVYELTTTWNGVVCTDQVTVPPCGCSIGISWNTDIGCLIADNNTTLTANGGFGDPSEWTWTWSPATGLNTTTGATVTVGAITSNTTYTATGVHTPTGITCGGSELVYATEPVYPSAITQDANLCPGESANIGFNPVVGWSYEWTPDDGSLDFINISNPLSTPTTSTQYIVTVEDIETECTVQDTAMVNVIETIVDANEDFEFCEGALITLGTPAVPNHTYSWSPATGLDDPTLAQPSIALYISAEFIVTATNTITNCSLKDTVVAIVLTPPTADAGADIDLCVGGSGIIGTPEVPGYTYQWIPADGLSDPTAAQPIATPSSLPMTYQLIVSTDNVGCFDSDVITINEGSGPCPVADAGADQDICVGDAVQIGTPTVSGATYSWTPTTGLDNPAIAQPMANPSSTTTYTVVMTTAGGSSIDDVTVTVHQYPTADAGPDQNICDGFSVVLGSPADDGTTYSWSPATGLDDPTAAQPESSATADILYTLTVTNSGGCISTDEVELIVVTPPTADAGADQSLCATAVQIGTPSVAGMTYSWAPNVGLSDNTIAQPTAAPPGEIEYILTVTDANGCEGTDAVLVTPDAIADAGQNKVICEGDDVTIGTPMTPGATYSWVVLTGDMGSLSSASVAEPTANPNVTSTYEVSVTNNGCTRTDEVTVKVNNISLDIGADMGICSGACTVIGIAPEAGFSYSWYPITGLDNPTSSMPTACPTSNTLYTLTKTDLATGCTITDDVIITIAPAPAPAADAGPDQDICPGESVQIGTDLMGNFSYAWTPTLGLNNPYIAEPMASPLSTTTYTVIVTDNANGCSRFSEVVITVNDLPVGGTYPAKTICDGGSIAIGTSGNPNYSYLWSPAGSLDDATSSNPVASPTGTTTYGVVITDNTTGCSNFGNITVNVNAGAPPAGVTGPDQTICAGATVDLGEADPGLGYTYTWASDLGGSFSSTNTSLTTFTPGTSLGTEVVTLTVSDGTCTAEYTVEITVQPEAIIDAGKDEIVCSTDAFLNAVSTPTGVTGTWTHVSGPNTPSITDINDPDSEVTGLQEGVHTFRWTVVGDVCNTGGFDEVIIQLAPIPTLVINDPNPICVGSTDITLPAVTAGSTLAGGTLSYWIDAATSIQLVDPTSVAFAGTYYIKLATPQGCEEVSAVVVERGCNGSIGDQVWMDLDFDGIQDAGEPGIAGVTVVLYDSNGDVAGTTVTDAYGNYLFTDLAPDTYSVQFTPLANYDFSTQNTGTTDGSDPDPNTGIASGITLGVNEQITDVDAGLIQATPTTASIGDYVWYDANEDGVQDATEVGLAGVTVSLFDNAGNLIAATVTDQSGHYQFSDLDPGTYDIVFTAPFGMEPSPQTANTTDGSDPNMNGGVTGITLVAGEMNNDIDAGFHLQDPLTGSIGDTVWDDLDGDGIQDAGEPGVPGVKVELYDATGTTVIATTYTDVNGNYIFNSLPSDDYLIKFSDLPTGYDFSPAKEGSDSSSDSDADPLTGFTNLISLNEATHLTRFDAGIHNDTPAGTASIGDQVWFDTNEDGVQDANESGVQGITVTLYNNLGDVVAVTMTDIDGNYIFTGLPAGDYSIEFDNLPDGYVFTTTGAGTTATDNDADANGSTGTFSVAAGEEVSDIDAGIHFEESPYGTGSIGDQVWYDLDNDGIQDPTEPGAGGITVTLYESDGVTVVATTTTDPLGNYIFTDLEAGDYIIEMSDLPAGYNFSPAKTGTDEDLDSDVNASGTTPIITITEGEDVSNIDAGIHNPTDASTTGTVGDFVWVDADQDGIQDAGEVGLGGVEVQLIENGEVVATTVTDENGFYSFVGVDPGFYTIEFNNPPNGFMLSPSTENTPDGSDPDPSTGETHLFEVQAGDVITDMDAGFFSNNAMLGNYVWMDDNSDGIQDAGEAPISGVTVFLYDASGNIVASTVTDANGYYNFANVLPGTYTVGFTTTPSGAVPTNLDAGGNDGMDSDVNVITFRSAPITLAAGDVNLTVDAGLVIEPLASVSDVVWDDEDGDGIQDPEETVGVPGVLVELYAADGTLVATTITDGNGQYQFNNLPSGDYYLEFSNLAPGTSFSPQNVGSDSSDSEADAGGATGTFTLNPGEHNSSMDIGIVNFNPVLPVELIEFRGQIKTDHNYLTWSTATEINTERFEIERSINGNDFSQIGEVKANGNSSSLSQYDFKDVDYVINQPNYYRLKIVDEDNTFEYSNVVVLKRDKTQLSFSYFPNPVHDQITIQLNNESLTGEDMEIKIIDVLGRTIKVYSAGVDTDDVITEIKLDLSYLASGNYMIHITVDDSFVTKKLTVTRP